MKTQKNTTPQLPADLTDEQLLNMDLDKVNIEGTVDKTKAKAPTKKATSATKKSKGATITPATYSPYNKVLDKSGRRKIRKMRNSFISRLIEMDKKRGKGKDTKAIKELIKGFNQFYKETYRLNDYSPQSLARANSDSNTMEDINTFIAIIKKYK